MRAFPHGGAGKAAQRVSRGPQPFGTDAGRQRLPQSRSGFGLTSESQCLHRPSAPSACRRQGMGGKRNVASVSGPEGATFRIGYYLPQTAQTRRSAQPRSGQSQCFFQTREGESITKVRVTRHNGRAGKFGTYNPKHNDRNFDVANSEHIDIGRTGRNVYWDWQNGMRTGEQPAEDGCPSTFTEAEAAFYDAQYAGFVAGQNARNAKSRHTERNRTTMEIMQDRRYCPEETIYQLGKEGGGASAETLLTIAQAFMAEFARRYGSHVHILDWALHLDEATPHIQERHVFDYQNRYGEIEPKQEKALEALGFQLPQPGQKPGRHNNRKMVFDAECRALLVELSKAHGLSIEEEPSLGGKVHREKNDFILAKQRETLAVQERHIEANSGRIAEQAAQISDTEQLLNQLAEAAYDQAIATVTEKVVAETQKADAAAIDGIRQQVLSPDRHSKPSVREEVVRALDAARARLRNTAARVVRNILDMLTRPEHRREAVRQVKEEARPSVLAMLRKYQEKQDRARKPSAPITRDEI